MKERKKIREGCLKYSPESIDPIVAEIGYQLERMGDVFLLAEEMEWLNRRRRYCKKQQKAAIKRKKERRNGK